MQAPRRLQRRTLEEERALSSVLCRREEFWEQLFLDLEQCTRSLSIVSPYVTVAGTERLSEYLKSLRARNVHIIVYTNQTKDQDKDKGCDSALEELSGLGVEVDTKRKIHAKIIVIDDYIWWEGSLNLLTLGKSLEQMRRFEGLQARNLLCRIGLGC